MRRILEVVALSGLLLAPVANAVEPITSCQEVGDAKPLCGFQNPEDIVPLPGGAALLVSEYGDMNAGAKPDAVGGRLVLLDLATEERHVLFERAAASAKATPGWGDAACPGPPAKSFSPHGIDLQKRADGALALAVVQHAARESVELFEVSGEGRDWKLVWRGCVLPEDESAWLNEVVLLEDGGFLASHMMTRVGGEQDFNAPSPGWVYRWAPAKGWSKVPGSEVPLANGIEVSPDEKTLFLNSSMGGGLRRIDLASGKVTGKADLIGLDNSTWAPDGKLLVAKLNAESKEEFAVCEHLERGACPIAFQIVAVDPESMETSVRFDSAGTPMGGGTVGLQVGEELFIGSFAGDRVLRVQLREAAAAQ